MISLLVDESFAFDYLSILKVKELNCSGLQPKENYKKCLSHLQERIPKSEFDKVLSSEEYEGMITTNGKVFLIIEEARKREIPAKVVDDLNNERYFLRKKLQKKFFTGCHQTETKTIDE